jgi:hypothetical protein
MGSDLVYSILSPEWNADKTRVDKVRYWTAVARLFLESICAGRSLWRRLDLWRLDHDSSHNILTLDALQVLSRSQVTPGLSMSMRIRPICKVYIHTCFHGCVCFADVGFDVLACLQKALASES